MRTTPSLLRPPFGRRRRRRVPAWKPGRGGRARLVLAAGAAAFLFAAPVTDAIVFVVSPLSDGETRCRVASVTDGDTIRLWCPGRGVGRARLLGYDTPELFSPRCPSELRRAWVATCQLRLILLGASELRMEREGDDRYGRQLVRVRVDGTLLSIRMSAAGHARPYDGGRRFGWY